MKLNLRGRIPAMTHRERVNQPFEVAPQQVPLSTKGTWQHLLIAPDGLWAWFELGPQRWRFQSTDSRQGVLGGQTLRWAELAGHRVHLIRVTRPTDYETWAEQLDAATPAPLTSEDPEAVTFADWYVGAQLRISELQTREPRAFLGVRVTTRSHRYTDLQAILDGSGPANTALGKTRQSLTEVTDAIRREGFDGRPLTAAELGLLLHSMTGLGAPVTDPLVAHCGDGWAPDEMSEFSDPVYSWAATLDKATTVNTIRAGVVHSRQVSVLDFGKMGERDGTDPARAPWMAAADNLPFPVTFSAQFDVWGGEHMERSAEFNRVRAENVAEHFREHGEQVPPSTERAISDARRIEDEVKDGEPEVAVRLAGVVYAAVAGDTAEEVDKHARDLIAHYRLRQKITLHHGFGQFARYRSFIPGETAPGKGFVRVLPAYYMPTALPNMATSIGDGEGPYLGRCGNSAFFFDPTYGPRNNMSGLLMVGGSLGAGKSHTVGGLVEVEALRGNRQVVVDGSGLLARLCDLPHLRDHSQHIELAGAAPGTLNPYWLVPDPRRSDYDTLDKHTQAVRDATAERRELAIDTFLGLQDPDFIREGHGRIVTAIRRTVNKFSGDYAMNPWIVVRELEHSAVELEREIGANLRDAAGMKGAALIFPTDEMSARVTGQALPDKILTVITMRGMQIPKTADKTNWTSAEKMVAPALHLVGRYATLAMYANQLPKGVWIDEGAILAGGEGSIRSFLARAILETRKTNTALGVIMQNPQAFLKIDPEIGNLVGAALVGRTTEPTAIEAWMRMMGIPAGHGYEKVFRSLALGAGHFIHLDWDHHVDTVVIDAEWRPDLMKVLDTTPARAGRVATVTELIPAEAVAV
jgi:hypothetical protein